ncbi:uncharacterized protein LOC121870652 [Homarus americanus]|uniref:Putative DZIP3/ hRUL138-like HEPN and NACHT domain-containing protein n=1 Tax=Homarus americanus TaxID=6706 RepID=A0A8J5K0V4_HOMAM|nr:uncharacterized protein LOC121870652 [Homarus americanus]KAG7165423.1 putative DZIP3/ hRUL138-like HEPN and NACHT domain-containing protein [Homarus americanus]
MVTPRPRSLIKTNGDKYLDGLDEVAQPEMCRVFLWLYQGGNQYVGEYLVTLPRGMQFLNKDQKKMLTNKEPVTNMDISLLYRLLQHTCGLAPETDRIWHDPVSDNACSLEHSLYLIKEERNNMKHMTGKIKQQMSDNECTEKIDCLRVLCCRILCEAARRCNRHDELPRCTDGLGAKLEDIKGVSPAKFSQLAKKEIKKTLEDQHSGGPLGGQYLEPRINCEDGLVSLGDLLRWGRSEAGELPPVILVSGDAGAGKTSLCQYLEDSWKREEDNIKDLLECDLLLLVYCRDVTTGDTVRLLQEDFLPETTAYCDPHRITTLLQELKVVWILDGLEEATDDAATLIRKILKTQPKSHTLLLTSRPEHSLALTKKYPEKKISKLTLCGVDPKGAFKKWLHLNNIIKCEKREKELITEYETLDKEVQKELQNPLKMQLVLQDWENTYRDLHQGFDLSRLYHKFIIAQKKLLVSKFTKGNVLEKEAEMKVEKWIQLLYNVAFDMTRGQRVTTIPDSVLRELENKCDDLKISSSFCLSTFLASVGNSRYSFFHSTQQHFFAAQYVTYIFNTNANVSSKVCQMFDICSLDNVRKKSLVNFYEVFLHLIFILGSSLSDDQLELLIKLLSHAILDSNGSSKWFEVVQKGSYDNRITERISRVIPEVWYVCDSCVKAARCLMTWTKPSHIVIELDKNPRHSPELVPLLHSIADLDCLVWVELYLSYHHKKLSNQTTSDKYLKMLCYKDSPCAILGFEGHLSNEAYDLLKLPTFADYCDALTLKVKSTESLGTLCEAMRDLQSLTTFHLTLSLRSPSYISACLPVKTDLHLPYMTDETVADTAKLISRLSTVYKSITVSNITGAGAKQFIIILREKGVTVGSFVQEMRDEKGEYLVSLSYGSLPLKYSVLDFVYYWLSWENHYKASPPTM